MKILWFPKLQFDTDKFHIVTWREMCRELERKVESVEIAIVGDDYNKVLNRPYIKISVIKKKILRALTFWIHGYLKFIQSYFKTKPDAVILDIYSIWFSFPFVFFPKRSCLFIVDNRTPFHNQVSQEDTPRDKIMKFYTKICYKYCRSFLDGMTVISEHYKQQVCKEFGFNPSTIGIWNSGVDLNKFSSSTYNKSNRPSFLEGKFVLMQHGEISCNRGILETIKAISMMERKDIVFVMLGDIIDSHRLTIQFKDELYRMIKDHELENRVYMLPPVPYSEVPKYVSYCDCGVMAYPNIEYWNNNNPIKLLEYFAMGKVVICTDMPCFRQIADSSKCAYYIENNDPELIANAINYCYEKKGLLNNWGKEGIDLIRKDFTWKRQAEKLINFIEELTKNE